MERHPIFAALYDSIMVPLDRLSFRPHRERTAAAATGRTLEVGIGTGLNIDLYRSASRIVGIEPDPEMLRRAVRRAREASKPVHLVAASAENLPFRGGSFDSVVASLVFCTIPDARSAAREVRRVLVPGSGAFHFFEHVRSSRPLFARLQDVATPVWKKLFGGCHPNRDTLPVFEKAGLAIESCDRPGAVLIRGTARVGAGDV
ncbi:MAG: class I SAM-dependent methyltransferase [Candidatus Binatia bacterium]